MSKVFVLVTIPNDAANHRDQVRAEIFRTLEDANAALYAANVPEVSFGVIVEAEEPR
jgi:hypothetical protein